ncbi:hypothetical protein N7451_006144 [Penicillium sp. IBT 35674x]|nr:hypothetical protein N7451_006144 [Penicillium sp. IBT 35674x]
MREYLPKLEVWTIELMTDFSGIYYCARVAGPIFRKQGSGNMIFTASISGHAIIAQQQVCHGIMGVKNEVNAIQTCYNACKAGVIYLAKYSGVKWADSAGVNSISPGYIDTSMTGDCAFEMKEEWYSLTPLEREGDPRELKGAYLYLASDASTYTTGSDIMVDGGYTY